VDIPADYAQSNILFGGSGAPTGAQVTMGHDISAFPGNPVDCGGAVYAAVLAAGIMSNVSDDVTLAGVLVKFGPVATGPSGLFTDTITGGVSGDAEAASVAYLIHKNTLFGGRTGSGRSYWPGVPEAGCEGSGALAGTYQSDVQTTFDNYLAELESALIPAVLLHAVGSPVSTPYFINALTVDARVATQRRRLRR
jgi:hypothetical protein